MLDVRIRTNDMKNNKFRTVNEYKNNMGRMKAQHQENKNIEMHRLNTMHDQINHGK